MAKTKTSALRASSSAVSRSRAEKIQKASRPFDPRSFEGVQLKANKAAAELEDHDPGLRLKDVKLVREALLEALMDGDHEAFKAILKSHLETVNKDKLSDLSGVSRTTLFRMLAPSSNPTLKNVARVFRVLKAG